VRRAVALALLLAACAGEKQAPAPAPGPTALPGAARGADADRIKQESAGRGPLPHDGSVHAPGATAPLPAGADLALPGETHLKNVRQLTFGGQNAEAYWSWDDSRLCLQITDDRNAAPGTHPCDAIHVLGVADGKATVVSAGGRTTCSYFLPGDHQLLFASTHEHGPDCPPEPDRSQGYVWPLYDYDIFVRDLDTGGLRNITHTPGYDAEATVAADGRIVFTSVRSGDIELWMMDGPDATPRQITHEPGYDGGAFFSHDGRKLVWRASRPADEHELSDYRALLAQGLVRPTRLEIYVANADGSDARQVTNNGKANFAPFFTPDDQAIVFASNMDDPQGRAFQLWKVNVDGSGLEQITHDPSGFNAFPMFSRDGTRLAFSSNRNGSVPHETNVFVADWVP
jgi:Tol biopolymer transport system component